MNILRKAKRHYRIYGVQSTIVAGLGLAVTKIGQHLPDEFQPKSRYGGVWVEDQEFNFVPVFKPHNTKLLRSTVSAGDTVVIIGVGHGVSVIEAGKFAGDDGSVVGFEASREYTQLAQKSIQMHGLQSVCEVKNKVIGEAIHTIANDVGEPIAASDIPHCDILELDCEGAELEIIRNLTIEPKQIIVETHPKLYQEESSGVLRNILREKGYSITKKYPDIVDGEVWLAELSV